MPFSHKLFKLQSDNYRFQKNAFSFNVQFLSIWFERHVYSELALLIIIHLSYGLRIW